MRERILFGLLAGLLAAATWWVWVADPGRIPILDFNRQVLAETEVEGFCAGSTFWKTRGAGSASIAKACRAAEVDLATDIDHSIVLISFCLGAQSEGFPGDVRTGCEDVIRGTVQWPTMTGRLTNAFDDTKGYPYPGNQGLLTPPSDSRTGTRDGFNRGDTPPTTTTTTEGEG